MNDSFTECLLLMRGGWVGLEIGVVMGVAGVGDRGGDEGATVEGGDEAEGAIEGGDQVRDEALEGDDEAELRLAAEGDGLLQAPALLAHGHPLKMGVEGGVGERDRGTKTDRK